MFIICGVLFQMHPGDIEIGQVSASNNRKFILGNLIAFWNVRIKIIFTIKFGKIRNGSVNRQTDFFAVMLMLATAAIVFVLGFNTGSWMLYFYELMSPFLIIVVFRLMSSRFRQNTLCWILLAFNSFLLPVAVKPWPKPAQREWAHWEDLIASHQTVFAGAPLAEILYRQGRRVYDTGHTEYAVFAADVAPDRFSPAVRQQNRAFMNEVAASFRERRFDLVVLTSEDALFGGLDLLRSNYDLVETRPIPMFFNKGAISGEIWLPKKL